MASQLLPLGEEISSPVFVRAILNATNCLLTGLGQSSSTNVSGPASGSS